MAIYCVEQLVILGYDIVILRLPCSKIKIAKNIDRVDINYEKISEAVNYINNNDNPLGLYYFGRNQAEQDFVINNTRSGGVTVNDTMFHILQSRLPFGGVGQSGHGCFHGYEGFLNFSHLKSIYHQTSIDFILAMIRPPRGKAFSLLSKIMKKLG